MRVLLTWGSKRGGTEGIARILGEALQREGVEVVLVPAAGAGRAASFDAAIVGGALYGNRWHPAARRFVRRQASKLRQVPVWMFSSGPLDDSAEAEDIPPVRQVRDLMDRVGALGHVTFGGRLEPGARGFPAGVLAKEHAGDWRRPERIRAWGATIARALPTARPGAPVLQPGGSIARLGLHALAGWAACAATMGALLAFAGLTAAVVIHAIAAPLIFATVSRHYFRDQGARDPLPTALAFVGTVAALDLVVVAGLIQRSLAMFGSVAGTWLPLLLIFMVTWVTGEVMATLPPPHPARE